MESRKALEEWYETLSTNDKIRWEDNYLSIKKDLDKLENLEKMLGLYDFSNMFKNCKKLKPLPLEELDNDK